MSSETTTPLSTAQTMISKASSSWMMKIWKIPRLSSKNTPLPHSQNWKRWKDTSTWRWLSQRFRKWMMITLREPWSWLDTLCNPQQLDPNCGVTPRENILRSSSWYSTLPMRKFCSSNKLRMSFSQEKTCPDTTSSTTLQWSRVPRQLWQTTTPDSYRRRRPFTRWCSEETTSTREWSKSSR